VPGLYVAGWVKRGPSGVIGTNKACAMETVASLVEDELPTPLEPSPAALDTLLAERGVRPFTAQDWKRLDEIETAAGEALGRPRVKVPAVNAMLAAVE
jgi:ferredoxin--NADP+ reductase